jgi:hypothetical protein
MSKDKKKSKTAVEVETSLIDDDISDDELTKSMVRAEKNSKDKSKKKKKKTESENESASQSESEAEEKAPVSKKRKKKSKSEDSDHSSSDDEDSSPKTKKEKPKKKKQKVESDNDSVASSQAAQEESKQDVADSDDDAEGESMLKYRLTKGRITTSYKVKDDKHMQHSDDDAEDESMSDSGPVKCDVKVCRDALIPFKLSSVAPTDEDLLNPNYQFQLYNDKYYTGLHYTQIFPVQHMIIKNAEGSKYTNVGTTLDQACDFLCSGNLVKNKKFYPFTNSFSMQMWGPFGVVSDPQMFPHGNKDPLRANDKFRPKTAANIRMRLPLRSDEYASKLGVDKDGIRVDRDQHGFMDYWMKQGFDEWIRSDAVWKYSHLIWPLRLKTLRGKVKEDLGKLMDQYKKQLEKYEEKKQKWVKTQKKTGMKAPVAPVSPEIAFDVEKKVRDLLYQDFRSPVTTKDSHAHVLYSRQLFVSVTKKESEQIANGESKGTYHAPTDYGREQYENPPKYECQKTGEMKAGFRRKMDYVRMYRGVTAEERQNMIANKIGSQCPMARVPFECSHIADGDIVAPLFSEEPYDSPLGAGWRQNLLAVLWIGTKGTLDMTRKRLDGVDPSSYFLVAQRYTRTKDFKVTQSVESSGAGGMTDEEAAQWNEFMSY